MFRTPQEFFNKAIEAAKAGRITGAEAIGVQAAFNRRLPIADELFDRIVGDPNASARLNKAILLTGRSMMKAERPDPGYGPHFTKLVNTLSALA